MFDISWLITVGSFRLSMLDSVEVIRSVEQLSDTAVIVLPGSVFNKAIEVEQKIKRGDKVVIMATWCASSTGTLTPYQPMTDQ